MKASSNGFSVLMSVYINDNCEYLFEALRSIYHVQTLKPSEIVIVADGELTYEQKKVIADFANSLPEGLLSFIQLKKNNGLAVALNEGLKVCRYELVARMDADDISLPTRFELQVSFMEKNIEIDVCGTYIYEVNSKDGNFLSIRKVPLNHAEIINFAKKRSPISHPSVMYRRSRVLAVDGYPIFRKSQDFALWSRMLVNGNQFANLSDVLLKMRTGEELYDRRGFDYFKFEYQVLNFQRKIGFIGDFEFLKNIMLRAVFRMMPNGLKKIAYSFLRR